MILTGVILAGIVVYVIWAIRKIQKNRKNGSCCSGGCLVVWEKNTVINKLDLTDAHV